MAVVWKDKRDMCLLTNIHNPPREGNYCNEHGNAIKPAIVADYNHHMGHLTIRIGWPIATRPATKHGSGQKKALFPPARPGYCQQLHPLIFMWWEENFTPDFRLTIIRKMLARFGHEPRPSLPVGRPAPASTNIGRLDTRYNKHWPGRNPKQQRCRMCSVRSITRTMLFKCVECDVVLCVDRSCFEDYHTKNHL